MYISVDLGGTKTRVASTKDLKHILEQEVFPTDQVLELEQDHLLAAIDEVSDSGAVKGICIGVPGFVNTEKQTLEKIVNVKALSGLKFTEVLKGKFSKEIVLVENDAALAGLGEAVFGAGKNHEVVAYLTLSTGVGGVKISGKRIERAAEPGHMIIKDEKREFSMCGQKGCFSYYCSGTGFQENYGVSPIDCTNPDLWRDYGQNLARGIINVVAMWSPDVIVLGGSMTKAYNYFRQSLEESLSQQSFFDVPPIEIANLGDNAGIMGGFSYLSQTL